MKRLYLSIITLFIAYFPKADAMPAPGSWARSLTPEILTPRIVTDGDWMLPPVIELGSEDQIDFSFDEMSHDWHRYTYHIDHCDARWVKSDLLYSEYMDGFDGEVIEDCEISENTNFEYSHYSLVFPNGMNSPKLSGNYLLSVLDGNNVVAQFRFCVVERMADVAAEISDVTDIDTRDSHQQVMAGVAIGKLSCQNPMSELKLTVMQNLRFDNAAIAVSPDFQTTDRVLWQHCTPMIFPAGNGFRRFEITDVYANMQNVQSIKYFDPYYHAVLNTDAIRRSYSFDGDHNGRFLVRSTETGVTDSDTGADYVITHFTLDSPQLDGGTPYLFFQSDAAAFSDRYRMEYDSQEHAYQLAVPLKLGAYDYQYLWVPDGSGQGETGRIEGDWYMTGNEYLLLLYQRRPGDRYDRLISVSSLQK